MINAWSSQRHVLEVRGGGTRYMLPSGTGCPLIRMSEVFHCMPSMSQASSQIKSSQINVCQIHQESSQQKLPFQRASPARTAFFNGDMLEVFLSWYSHFWLPFVLKVESSKLNNACLGVKLNLNLNFLCCSRPFSICFSNWIETVGLDDPQSQGWKQLQFKGS